MFGLKTDTNTINKNGSAKYEIFADVSTRSLGSILVGESAGKVSKGNGNAFVGFESGKDNINGSFDVFVGFQAGAFNKNGNWNTFVGGYSGKNNDRGYNNTFIGFRSGELNNNASECTAVGVNAMRENTVGNRNVAIGISAGERILEGDDNTMIGSESGQNIRSGNLNTMAGYRSGRGSFRGNENTYFGAYSGYSNSSGDGNSLIGYRSGEYLVDGNYNVGVGIYALQNSSSGNSNIAIGAFAGSSTTGSGNVILGSSAGKSNIIGDNNTTLGSEAGYNASGGENVYIGKGCAYNLTGQKNVIIGVDSLSEPFQNTSGSVILGYNVANNNFKIGSNNIFIGEGADSHIENTSFAIAIGCSNTNAGLHNIAIGENIDNGGINSILLGYSLYSDTDQSVSIGHNITVNNVIVFNDPLNWRFPVSSNKEYATFKLSENYTNTLYLGGLSNTVANATIYSSNIYNSSTHIYENPISTGEVNLFGLFDYNIIYHPKVLVQQKTTILNTTFDNYINTNDLFRITNNLNIDLPEDPLIINPTNISTNYYNTSINISSVFNANTKGSYNLIPITSNSIGIKIFIPKRVSIDRLQLDSSKDKYILPSSKLSYILNNASIPIIDSRNETASALDISKTPTNMEYINKYYIHKAPAYGEFNATLFNDKTAYQSITYTIYPESMYATNNDTFSSAIINQIHNLNYTNEGVIGLIPEDYDIQNQQIEFQNDTNIYTNPNIYLHPITKTIIDRAYLNIIPYSQINTKILKIMQVDPNIRITYNNTQIDIINFELSYNTFTTNPIALEVINKDINITLPLIIQFDNNNYLYNCSYISSNIHTEDINANVTIDIPTFSTESVIIPYDYKNFMAITHYPKYGNITLPTSLQEHLIYTPFTYNFGNDSFTFLYGNTTGQNDVQNSNIRVNIRASGPFKSLVLNKMQEPEIIENPVLISTTLGNTIITKSNLFTIYSNSTLVKIDSEILTMPDFFGHLNTFETDNVEYNEPYANITQIGGINFEGYVYYSNITSNYEYIESNYEPYINLINNYTFATPLTINPPLSPNSNGVYQDYIVYSQQSSIINPRLSCNIYNWDYENTIDDIPKNRNEFYNLDTKINSNEFYILQNEISSNRYYLLDEVITNEKVYKYASNIYITYSNNFNKNDIYYDTYSNHIYTTNTIYTDTINTYPISSNYTLLDDKPTFPQYSVIISTITSNINVNHFIPTIQLTDNIVYEYEGQYNLLNTNTTNFTILQKDIGIVRSFNQSNITNKEIHIYNSDPLLNINTSTLQSVLFSNNKTVNIRYFKNSTQNSLLNITNPTASNIFNFNNGITDDSINLESATSLINIGIQYTCNINLINNITNLPTQDYVISGGIVNINAKALIQKDFNNTSFVDYICYNDSSSTKIIRKYFPTACYINQPIYLNTGLECRKTFITASELLFVIGDNLPNEIYYTIQDINENIQIFKNNIEITTFTQEDINNKIISITGSIEEISIIRLSIQGKLNQYYKNTDITPINLTIYKYLQNKFLPSTYTSSNILSHINNLYQHDLLGPVWDNIKESFVDYDNLNVYICKNPLKGFLYSSNLGSMNNEIMINKLTYNELITHKLHYIPYNPMVLSNDTFQCFLEYSNIISQVYTLSLKNYWCKTGDIVIPLNNKLESNNLQNTSVLYDTRNFKISEGMKTDNINWTTSNIEISGMSLQNSYSLSLNYDIPDINCSIIIEAITERPYFKSGVNQILEVDLGNYRFLDNLLEYVNNPSQYLIFFIIEPSREGVILKELSGNNFTPVSHFTSDDILAEKVFYQHYGSGNEMVDTISLKVGTSMYDLSASTHIININISAPPIVQTNKFNYIYYENDISGRNSYNLLDNSILRLSKGSLYIYEETNIEVFKVSDNNSYMRTKLVTTNDLNNNKIYYRPSNTLFENNYNKNSDMIFNFIINNNEMIKSPNKLSVFPIYNEVYTQSWISKYNTIESYNEIIEEIPDMQYISYTKIVDTPDTSLSFADKKCTFQFDYYPYQPSLINEKTNQNSAFCNKYISLIQTYKYSFELLDKTGQIILKAIFTKEKIDIITHLNESVIIDKPELFNIWNVFNIINFDDNNNRKLSIYVNGTTYTNLNSIDLSNLHKIQISIPIKDPLNYQNQKILDIGNNTKIYYNLTHFNTQLQFRNFKILLEADSNNSTYNVALGDELKINGFNNICIGKNFATSGNNSIIVGNDIGSSRTVVSNGVFNEIFNSIIISTTSFINTKVRDIIAIGNNILNDISTGSDIDEFLAKNPVLIGNNIDITKLDFHINFQNTFVKTNKSDNSQIYCGLEEEIVGIGYTSNQNFSDKSYKLHINGGINVSGNVVYSNGTDTFTKKESFGNIRFLQNISHMLKIRASWSNTQSTYYNTFSINVKFRFIEKVISFGNYNFECWINTLNSDVSPSLLSSLISHEHLTDSISNINYECIKHNQKSIDINIMWNMVNLSQIIIGTVELECVGALALGDIKFEIIQ